MSISESIFLFFEIMSTYIYSIRDNYIVQYNYYVVIMLNMSNLKGNF